MRKLSLLALLIISIACFQEEDSNVVDIASIENPIVYTEQSHLNYSWLAPKAYTEPLINRFNPRKGFTLVNSAKGSFQEWLSYLPMEPKGTDIKLFNGKKKSFQLLNAGVIKIDIGDKDLQQCADAVMRLRAEYLYASKRYKAIHFNYTSGFKAEYAKWRKGYKISVKNNKVSYYLKKKSTDTTYVGFQKYLYNVFNYAGTYSLNKELKSQSTKNIKAGDVLIIGGFPGHVIIVLAVAQNAKGEKEVLLGQSYMPAQSIHVLKNSFHPTKGAWFSVERLEQKGWNNIEWSYEAEHLKTW